MVYVAKITLSFPFFLKIYLTKGVKGVQILYFMTKWQTQPSILIHHVSETWALGEKCFNPEKIKIP